MKFLNKILLSYLTKNNSLDEITLLKISLGIDIFLLNIPKFIIIILISYTLNVLDFTLIIALIFCTLRTFSLGLHANNGFVCFCVTAFIFIAEVYIAEAISISIPIYLFIMLTASILFF